MAKLELAKIGNPVLRKKLEQVDPGILSDRKFRKLLKDMADTMRAAEGVGLAANQVGKDLAVAVIECKSNVRYPEEDTIPLEFYLNPVIIDYSEEKINGWEGCLSIPGYRGLVARSASVTFEAVDSSGESVRRTVSGFWARVLQHEVDHLNGLFYMDRMADLQNWVHLDEFNKAFETRVHDE
ncbi:MAG: peptide deformylase [Candidatus Omnitrophota bacterium]|jgi:peptide deformylase